MIVLASDSPNVLPGIAVHFAVAVLLAYLLVRLSRTPVPWVWAALLAVFLAFGLGFAWRHLGFSMWAALDDLIIDPYKDWQILKPRGENIACVVAFTAGPLLAALAVSASTAKRLGQDPLQSASGNAASRARKP